MAPPQPTAAARAPLSRDRILAAAVTLIDQRGLPQLTMRRLGGELGVEAMSLYRYIEGREQLLDAVVERLLADLSGDLDVVGEPTDGWRDLVGRLARGLRRITCAHPRAFPLVASRPGQPRWLRPPLRSLRWAEVFLRGLSDAGFTPEQTVTAYRTFTSVMLGHLLLEAAQRSADLSSVDLAAADCATGQDGLAINHPLLAELRPTLSEDHAAADFEDALRHLLKRLQRLL